MFYYNVYFVKYVVSFLNYISLFKFGHMFITYICSKLNEDLNNPHFK